MIIDSAEKMQEFGERIGTLVRAGSVIELVGDVGAGKTTFVRGMAHAMGIQEAVQSPSFTISRVYDNKDHTRLAHYDFYRLADPGIMANEIADELATGDTVIVIEWAEAVDQLLPKDRLVITITARGENERDIVISSGGSVSGALLKEIQ